jgi:hypothetical protein
LLDGAAAELAAGSPARAQALLDQADRWVTGQPARARARHLRGTVSLVLGRFRGVPSVLLQAARELEPAEPGRARQTLLDALYAGLMAGRLVDAGTLLDVSSRTQLARTLLEQAHDGTGAARRHAVGLSHVDRPAVRHPLAS